MPQDLALILELAVALATPLGLFVFGLWKWDARRAEHREKELKQQHEYELEKQRREGEERAREREHELQMAKTAAVAEHQIEIKTLQSHVINLQKVVEERLFDEVGRARKVQQDLTQEIQKHMLTIQNASAQEMEAIQALHADVTSLRGELPAQYREILACVGQTIEQLQQTNNTVTDLVTMIAEYHETVEYALREGEEQDHDERSERSADLAKRADSGRGQRGTTGAGDPGERPDPGPDRDVRGLAGEK